MASLISRFKPSIGWLTISPNACFSRLLARSLHRPKCEAPRDGGAPQSNWQVPDLFVVVDDDRCLRRVWVRGTQTAVWAAINTKWVPNAGRRVRAAKLSEGVRHRVWIVRVGAQLAEILTVSAK